MSHVPFLMMLLDVHMILLNKLFYKEHLLPQLSEWVLLLMQAEQVGKRVKRDLLKAVLCGSALTEADKEEMEALRGVVRPPSAQSVAAAAANAAAASVGNVAVDGEESVAMVAAACRAMAAGDVVRVRTHE